MQDKPFWWSIRYNRVQIPILKNTLLMLLNMTQKGEFACEMGGKNIA